MLKPDLQISESLNRSEEVRSLEILIATDEISIVAPLAHELNKLGYKTRQAFFDGSKLSSTPVKSPAAILCYFEKYLDKSSNIARALKSYYARNSVPVIGILQKQELSQNSIFDSVLVAPVHTSQIATRVNSLIRLTAMEQEISLRVETLEKDFGKSVSIEDDGKYPPFRILFIGKATPSFMVVMNSLQEKNVEIVAAFTSFSAFDYLHETDFDAVVMNAIESSEPALSISETMRRNSRLYNVPTLFLADTDSFAHTDAAYKNGAQDIIDIKSDTKEIGGRILELANYHRLHSDLKEEFQAIGDEDCIENISGCYNRTFMEKHAFRVVRSAAIRRTPISFLAIKLRAVCDEPIEDIYFDSAILRVGQMIKNLVRMQDTVSHYSKDEYLLMLPDTTTFETNRILERIRALTNCTAYESNVPNAPLTIKLEHGIVEVQESENANIAINRVMTYLEREVSRHKSSALG
jgi:two-component system cell cycle response regulator PopA